ncbi:cytochrome P450 3A30-like isoform X1 [Pseudorasbora parva]|uniref:cytochrome P450 3A30-like isoform X1 n=1 Tax=Pseudorasbora parva TaxID=51549 RepID=UPI00351DAA88
MLETKSHKISRGISLLEIPTISLVKSTSGGCDYSQTLKREALRCPPSLFSLSFLSLLSLWLNQHVIVAGPELQVGRASIHRAMCCVGPETLGPHTAIVPAGPNTSCGPSSTIRDSASSPSFLHSTQKESRINFRLNGPLYDAVTVAEDDDWRRIRSVLSPSFTSGRLKEMFGIMKTHSKILVQNLGKSATREENVDIKEFFGAYSMDVVTSTAFSVDIDSLNNPKDPFVTNIKKMLKFDLLNPVFLICAIFPFIAPLMEKMEFSLFPTSVTDFFYAALQKIKSEKMASDHKKKRVDFLQLMIDSQTAGKTLPGEEHTEKGLSDHEILSQAMVFIFAGYETSSSTLTFFFYNLATNPEAMEKLQEEIDETFPNKAPVDYEAVMNMDYLDAALNESLRLFPVASRLERVCKKTVDINGLIIPKDMVVMIPTYALHRDPDYWSDPESFKPERFTKGNKETIDPYMYMPFGLGPRNCIGMRFAQVTMKLAIVEVLQRFDVSVCEETQVPLELGFSGLLAPKDPIKLKLMPRTAPDV